MKSKGIIVATAVAAALTIAGCHQKAPQAGSAQMGPAAKAKSSCGANKCKANRCAANKCSGRKDKK